jgi:hypothetical protein
MAWKPWYERAVDMHGKEEVEEFMRGVFGYRPKHREPIIAGLVAGYVGGKVAAASAKRANKK